MKEKLNKFMEKLQKQNPSANWANLLTGLAVLVMVAVFSYAYFTKSRTGNMVIDDSGLVKQVTGEKAGEGKESEGSAEGSGTGTGTEIRTEAGTESGKEASEPAQSQTEGETPAEVGEKGAEPATGTTVVQKGEGLWHVAQRVCGDGEKYNVLAGANGLSVWEELNEGMTLKVVCK